MPPLAVLPVALPALPRVRVGLPRVRLDLPAVRAQLWRLPSAWPGAAPDAAPDAAPLPPPPARSADVFMVLFVSLFLLLTAALLRLVPCLAPLRPPARWRARDALPFPPPDRHALRSVHSAFVSYGAVPRPPPPALHARQQQPSYEALLEIADRIGTAQKGLTPDQIDILPTYVCGENHLQENSSRRGSQCAVCRDLYQLGHDVCILPCADEFHKHCIAPWLAQQATCPLCRCRFA